MCTFKGIDQWEVFGLSQDVHRFVWKFSVNSLKQDLANDAPFNPPLFSFANTFKFRPLMTTQPFYFSFKNFELIQYWMAVTKKCLEF